MMNPKEWDVLVVGAGPAGLAAALAAHNKGASTAIIEREDRPGGILKQCIHDGFGLVRFGEKLTGPEYAFRDIRRIEEKKIPVFTETYLEKSEILGGGFGLHLVNNRAGVFTLRSKALVFATGCRERTARQVFIHGTRPSGIWTAGLAQYFINIQGYMPCRRCVILGSGDIGLIMARRLTLEGAEVEGVYEVLPEPSGLTRNVVQCLEDYAIPLHLSSTVTRVHGEDRVEGVTVSAVDAQRRPVPGTERYVECDCLILSVGLIPENEGPEALGTPLDRLTGGPIIDQRYMSTALAGLFSCGNALHVSDLVDYVSETGHSAGEAAAVYALGKSTKPSRKLVPLRPGNNVRYTVPQYVDVSLPGTVTLFFRSSRTLEHARATLSSGETTVLKKTFPVLRPPEMERLEFQVPENGLEDALVLHITGREEKG
ncbi:MAG: FAD-dependent oxidoreductase [Spirochaetales bacterium]|nr:FAD-dependent oxidoreductase [Spirochaetales bacterium]